MKIEDRFVVVNLKYFNNLTDNRKDTFWNILEEMKQPNNRYYICNTDEPYADKVLEAIRNGEDEKYRKCAFYGGTV